VGIVIRLVHVGIVANIIAGCGGQPPSRDQNLEAPAPAHTVVATEDASIGPVKRLQVRVSLPGHYPQASVEQVARAVVANVQNAQPVNAVAILFYGPGTSTEGIYDVARIEWAPNGQWGDARSVRAGDYRTFRYSVSYNDPKPSPPASVTLAVSREKGLLGAPLPEGVKLVERQPGDPASGRDPSERYSLSASADELAAFFDWAMPMVGWAKEGTSTSTALMFRKGPLMLGIIINRNGGAFTLMGS